ncbi:twin-arginine translocation signal domain-containing protein [Sphingomonas sp. BT-65]|uniref:twin-arginine translocation signal domain-containing protein n=1 Tax=Sphingomonas sp. BT-65 TaxID=2989821 RepID=UPI002236B838|nr:twin-arginine translocation signal domain-containing protein [Sphingomonas sp. BT-65]MCW4463868.1 twin-arginine translocation signal domain-containing protein [Sphingomonas sp. BT-65]
MGRRSFLAGSGAIAAGLAGVLVLRDPPLGLWPSFAELLADYRTGPGQRQKLVPMAGIELELNTRSSLSLDGGGILPWCRSSS